MNGRLPLRELGDEPLDERVVTCYLAEELRVDGRDSVVIFVQLQGRGDRLRGTGAEAIEECRRSFRTEAELVLHLAQRWLFRTFNTKVGIRLNRRVATRPLGTFRLRTARLRSAARCSSATSATSPV